MWSQEGLYQLFYNNFERDSSNQLLEQFHNSKQLILAFVDWAHQLHLSENSVKWRRGIQCWLDFFSLEIYLCHLINGPQMKLGHLFRAALFTLLEMVQFSYMQACDDYHIHCYYLWSLAGVLDNKTTDLFHLSFSYSFSFS